MIFAHVAFGKSSLDFWNCTVDGFVTGREVERSSDSKCDITNEWLAVQSLNYRYRASLREVPLAENPLHELVKVEWPDDLRYGS